MNKLPKAYRNLQQAQPELFAAYENLGKTASESGPLDYRPRELIKLGVAAAQRAESAVQSHTHRALDAGVTPEEIQHTVLLGITTMGFPAMMTALAWVLGAIEDHFED
jgi:4-carboxymuconolactone decarboxylase